MGIPPNVYHVVFGGALAGGEQWESGFWVEGAVPSSQGVADATAELWYGQLCGAGTPDSSNALVNALNEIGSTDTTVTYVKVYCYPTGGNTATYIGEHVQTITPGTTARTIPDQCCVVVSLRTGHAGRSYRGRMYLPAAVLAITSNGNFNTNVAQDVADTWGLCFSDWNESGDNGQIVVVSRTRTATTPVTQVRVDTRIDIQRRRANRQAITAVTSADVTPMP